jgi:hypothetical protein
MLDLSSTKSIHSNPLLAKQFIKYISAFELLTVIDEANKKGDLILNNQSIIDGILDSNDEGKLLLLASGSKLDEFARSDKFLTLYNKGDVFKSALFGNSQYDWYALSIWNSEILDTILEDVLKEDSQLKKPFYKNPRMDRKLIASIIKAKDFDRSKHTYDFTKINFYERYTACSLAIDVDEIRSEHYYGKDSPDNNELYFSRPHDALLVLVRDLFLSWDDEESYASGHLTNLIHYADKVDIGLDYDDWLTEDEQSLLESKYSDFSARYDQYHIEAFHKLIEFFNNQTSSYKPIDKKSEEVDLFRNYSRVCITITIIPKLLSSYRLRDSTDVFLPIFLNSNNWVMRASGYSFIFQNIDILKDTKSLDIFIERYKAVLISVMWWMYSSSHLIMVSRVNREAYHKINDLLDSLNLEEDMIKFFDDIGQFLYGYQYRDIDNDVLEKKYEDHIRYNSYKSIIKYIDLSQKPQEGLSYKLGKTVGKLFK